MGIGAEDYYCGGIGHCGGAGYGGVPGKIVKKDYLLNKIWGGDAYGEDNYIEVYMSRVRKLLKKLGSKAKIVTVRGLGYKLVEG